MKNNGATQVLRNDHKRLKALFRQFEAVDMRAHQMKAGVARQAFMELELHGQLEEEAFYPALQAVCDSDMRGLLSSCIEAHNEVQSLIGELKTIHIDDEQFALKFQELAENVEAHIEEEERTVLPVAEKLLNKSLGTLGEHLRRRREELRALPRYQNSLQNQTGKAVA